MMKVSSAYPVQSTPQAPAVQEPAGTERAGEAQAVPVPAAEARRARFDEYVPEAAGERTTANTDRVDGELRQLKQRQAALEQKLSRAEEGGAEERELEQLRQQLEAVRSELTQKDNDAYRKGHTVFTDG